VHKIGGRFAKIKEKRLKELRNLTLEKSIKILESLTSEEGLNEFLRIIFF
jgi:hypothetical protein